jgi:hypothetical protein
MKRTLAIAFFSLGTLFTLGASAQDRGVQATVPFDFTVGGRLLPADTYTITSPSSGIVIVQDKGNHVTAITTVSADANQSVKSGGKLIFIKYGDQYFLHEVLCPAAGMAANIPTTKLEKRIQHQEAMVRGGEPVLVATR